MLAIDDLKKLAEMQELLLKRTSDGREANLEKYKKIVIQIDEYGFAELCSELEKVNDHNQTFEEELQFLEQVRSSWKQLDEQQLVFREVCELYGDYGLQLSNLSQVNIEYIDSRISNITGYLINNKNIEDNKNKLEKLSQELITAEKNKVLLSKRLLEFEELLKKNFINAEGRIIVDGELRFTSVISEYKEVGFDFKQLLEDKSTLKILLSKVEEELFDVEEKLKTATFCYNNLPSDDNKQILDDINKEYLKVSYRLTMLKILELLLTDCNEYVLFKRKRSDLLSLIKDRHDSLVELGVHFSIDPFNMTKVAEQIDMISSLRDNSEDINRIREEIAELSDRLDMMTLKYNDYVLQLNNVKNLVGNKFSMSDIDTSVTNWSAEDYFEESKVMDNQVVGIKDIPVQFKVLVVEQKTRRVVRRVYEMINSTLLTVEKNESQELTPELVIVQPSVMDNMENKLFLGEEESSVAIDIVDSVDSGLVDIENGSFDVSSDEFSEKLELEEDTKNIFETDNSLIVDKNLFVTVDPFLETPMFSDRIDDVNNDEFSIKFDDLMPDKQVNDSDILTFSNSEKVIESNDENNESGLSVEMPDAFWTVHEENIKEDIIEEDDVDVELSFDEQIEMLRLDEHTTGLRPNRSRVKKLEIATNMDKKAA